MFIKELNLIAFGKFKNKIVSLDEGINIIYGENEAGKTTIHKFIEGMFFGFFRPYTKVKRYNDDYEKYIPWGDREYKGALKFYADGNTYRLERNFLKGYDEVKMFDDITGDDVTNLLEYDPVIKLSLPGAFLLDVNNSVVYNNTVSIKQLGSETDEGLMKEVKDNLMNVGGSLDEDVSIKNALNSLDAKKDEIGTKRRKKTSPYGNVVWKLDILQKERKKALERYKQVLKEREKLNFAKERIEVLKVEKEKVTKEIENLVIIEKANKYHNSLKVKKEIRRLKEIKKKLDKYSGLNSYDYEKLLLLNKEKENVEENISSVEKDLVNINKDINDVQSEINALNELKDPKNMKKNKIITIIFLILALTFFGLGFINSILFFIIVPFGLGLIYFLYLKNKLSKERKDLNDRISYILEYKAKYNEELKRNYIEKEKILNDIQILLDRNKSTTLEEFKEGLENKKRLKEIEIRLRLLNLNLDKILGNDKLEELEEEIIKNDSNISSVDTYKTKEDLKGRIEEIEKEMNNEKVHIVKVEESIIRLSDEFKPLVEIDEEIIRLKQRKEYYEKRLNSINLAKETIENISKKIHKQFAPTLNKKVSRIINEITDGRYKEVKINENIDITVAEPIRKKMKTIDCLSGGTVDQLYFATRLAIIDIINEKKVPLILDDCFIQYDQNRLVNILNILGKESSQKQIILFTCHYREMEILDRLNLKYNCINI